MSAISDTLKTKANALIKRVISQCFHFDHGALSLDVKELNIVHQILEKVERDEISNIQAQHMLDTLEESLIADIKAKEEKRITNDKEKRIRSAKGRNLLCLLDNYVVLDLETTGLDPVYDSIIEVGIIRVENEIVTAQYQSLVNPGYQIDPYITELTGITDAMLIDAPTIDRVLPQVLSFVGSYTVIGHNVNFDINFLYSTCIDILNLPFSNDFVDTMRLSRRLFPHESHHRLSDLIVRFGIADIEQHRALSDAIQTNDCYTYMKTFMRQNSISEFDIQPLYEKYRIHSFRAKNITPNDCAAIDSSSPVYNRVFVFTGALEKMVRTDAMQHVVNLGGVCGDSVTKKTNFLVLGNNDYCPTIRDGKSSKQKKAEEYKLKGYDIQIISENVFYSMIGVQ